MTLGRIIIFSALLLLLESCTTSCTSNKVNKDSNRTTVSVMTYNVENLFDTQDDEGKEDETYLPLSMKKQGIIRSRCKSLRTRYYVDECLNMDWSESMLDKKMHRITDVVMQVNEGRGPDILILQEVENKNVLNIWKQKYLAKAEYGEPIIIEGKDERGIDVAILTRLKEVAPAKLHDIDFTNSFEEKSKYFKSRGILQAKLGLPDGAVLNVFANHFPSQGNPRPYREKAVARLNELKKGLPSGELAIAGGDFNITSQEDREGGLYSKHLGTEWVISHIVGCHDCKGTEYFHKKREWSFFDALLFNPQFVDKKSQWQLDPDSIYIPLESKYQVSRHGTPSRFNQGTSKSGVSDHWPIYAEIYLNKKEVTQKD